MAKISFKANPEDVISRLSIAFVVVLVLLLAWGVILVRDKLLENADAMGVRLAQSYAEQEQDKLDYYGEIVTTSASSLNRLIESGAGDEKISSELVYFTDSINNKIGVECFDLYAVVNGKILSANPWEGDSDYDYAKTRWYQDALSSTEVSISDAYTDVITGEYVVTFSIALEGSGNVLAADVNLDYLPLGISEGSLPENTTYFLFDSNDIVLVSQGVVNPTSKETREYLNRLIDNVRHGKYSNPDASIVDLDGNLRGIYYFEMDNGWLSIITIPFSSVLQEGWDSLFVGLGAICIVILVSLIVLIVRENQQRNKQKDLRKTLKILGDRHYAIYRINLKTERYLIIKRPKNLPLSFPNRGHYSDFMLMMEDNMEDSIYADFFDAFSINHIRELLDEGVKDFGGDYRRQFDGEYRWVNVRCIYNKELSENDFLLCFREISQRKEAELQRQELIKNVLTNAERVEERKNEFFSKASHDMRTPLNAIVGFSGLLEKNADNLDLVVDYAKKIHRSGDQLLALVNDILDLSRIDATKHHAQNLSLLDLAQCIREVVETFQLRAQQEHKTLTLIGADEPVYVLGDTPNLVRIFNNLLSNAVKYTNEGDRIEVIFRKFMEEGTITKYQVIVADTGVGMTKEFLEHLFEPFSRETRFAERKVSGTGLGMSIVKSLIRGMDGEITVTSTLGQGSTFIVTLPLAPAPECQSSKREEETYNKSIIDLDSALKGMTILVAEDNEINREIIFEFLHMMGAEVLEAVNGKEALDIFVKSKPGYIDAILMDMFMPEMDGCSATQKIRSLARSDAKTVTILAVTANAFAEDIAQTTKAGMDGHLSKPIDPEKLASLILEKTKY